jgi:two-component system KDP operon response regulator KdpE
VGRLLVADDDEDLRALLARRLSRRGWEVTVAADGAEAVRLAIADPPDVAILDRSMPVMSGPEALAALRADPGTAAVPVLMLTGEDEVGAGGDAVAPDVRMGKPFELDALDAALRELAIRSRDPSRRSR